MCERNRFLEAVVTKEMTTFGGHQAVAREREALVGFHTDGASDVEVT